MNILVIGNGFDLAHGLPTKYWDFMMFIKNFRNLDFRTKEEIQAIPIFQVLNDKVKEFLLKDEVFYDHKRNDILRELKELIYSNLWIRYFDDKILTYENKGWIDFESEISEVIKSLQYLIEMNNHEIRSRGTDFKANDEIKNKIIESFFKIWNRCNSEKEIGDIRIIDFYGENSKHCINKLNSDLNGLIRCLEIYLEEVVEKIDINYKIAEIEELNIDKLISFNYTNTYQRVYEIDKDKIEYDYIHGKLDISKDMKKNNMVLGIDEYLENEERNIKLDFIQFKKYFQRIYKKTGCIYKKWIKAIEEKEYEYDFKSEYMQLTEVVNNIYIFGHSLDITDKDIFKEIILGKNIVTTIFYHDDTSHYQYIANLVRIIGQDELIKRVYGTNPSIMFKEIQK